MDACHVDSCGLPYEWISEVPQTIKKFHIKYVKGTQSDSAETNISNALYSMIVFICTFVALCFIGTSITVFEYLNKWHSFDNNVKDKKITSQETGWLSNYKPILRCFCLITNTRDLLNTSSGRDEIPCLHGIRALSEFCIVMFHIFGAIVFVSARKPEQHALFLRNWFPHIGMIIIFHAVDALFVLSGLLNAHSYFQNEARKKRKSWIYFFVHRFLRLTPVYVIVLAFYATIFQNMAANTSWASYFVKQTCMEYKWHSFLYISNFDPIRDVCMPWSWSLPNDMQFFVISPIILISMWRWPKFGYSILGLLIFGSGFANFVATYYFNLPNAFLHLYSHLEQKFILEEFIERFFNYLQKIYFVSYGRISTYIIGIGTGYCIFQWHQRKNPKLSSYTLKRGWTVASILMIYIIFGVSRSTPTLVESALYNAINQICFAGALSWIIFLCSTNHGGILNDLLSSKMLIPLSRLSYCAYLSHPILVLVYTITLEEPLEFSIITLGATNCCLALSSFVIALFLYLVFESPFSKLERMMWKRAGY